MQKFLLSLTMIAIVADCTFSTAQAFPGWFKPKVDEYGNDQDGVAERDKVSSPNGKPGSGGFVRMPVKASGGSGSGSQSGDSGAAASAKTESPMMRFYNETAGFNPSSVRTQSKYTQSRGNFNCSTLSKICAAAPKNCEKAKKVISNGEALDYTLQYLSDNYERLQDPSCHSGSSYGNDVKKGFSNASNGKGKFILNDTDTRLGNGRSQAHYVDLCGGEYHSFGMKMGTGSTFLDAAGKRSTLIGAFMTGKQKTRFSPYSWSGYKKAGLNDPYQVEVVGLNSSNSQTDDSKPIHESPFNTSWGCPSIDRSSFDLLNKIKGGHLMMTYRRGYMQRLGKNASCRNGRGAGSGFSQESVMQDGGTQ